MFSLTKSRFARLLKDYSVALQLTPGSRMSSHAFRRGMAQDILDHGAHWRCFFAQAIGILQHSCIICVTNSLKMLLRGELLSICLTPRQSVEGRLWGLTLPSLDAYCYDNVSCFAS